MHSDRCLKGVRAASGPLKPHRRYRTAASPAQGNATQCEIHRGTSQTLALRRRASGHVRSVRSPLTGSQRNRVSMPVRLVTATRRWSPETGQKAIGSRLLSEPSDSSASCSPCSRSNARNSNRPLPVCSSVAMTTMSPLHETMGLRRSRALCQIGRGASSARHPPGRQSRRDEMRHHGRRQARADLPIDSLQARLAMRAAKTGVGLG